MIVVNYGKRFGYNRQQEGERERERVKRSFIKWFINARRIH